MKMISKREQLSHSFIAAPQHLNGTINVPGRAPKNDSILPVAHPVAMAYIASYQPTYRLIHVSPQIANLGFSPEAWLTETDLRLRQIHKGDFDRVSLALMRSRRTGEKFNCYYRLYDSNGKMRWLHDEARIVLDASGAPLLASGVMLDITYQKGMEAELHEFRYSLEWQTERAPLVRRVTESCNEPLGDRPMPSSAPGREAAAPVIPAIPAKSTASVNSAWAQRIIALTRDSWIAHGGYKPRIKKTPAKPTILHAKQRDSHCDWARIGWRVTAVGLIA